jgi:hypothetical protein
MTHLRTLTLAALAATALTLPLALPAGAAEIVITDKADTALAVAIDNAVEGARQSIAACRDGGGSVEKCICEKQGDIGLIRDALGAALAAHPEWENRPITFEIGEGSSRTMMLNGVAKMAQPSNCN